MLASCLIRTQRKDWRTWQKVVMRQQLLQGILESGLHKPAWKGCMHKADDSTRGAGIKPPTWRRWSAFCPPFVLIRVGHRSGTYWPRLINRFQSTTWSHSGSAAEILRTFSLQIDYSNIAVLVVSSLINLEVYLT